MPNTMQVGNELAEVPFGDLIENIAEGIADGQRALDLTSLQTLRTLANTPVQFIPEIVEVLTAETFPVNVSGQAPVQVTGVRVSGTPSAPVTLNALQAGIVPTFYQFTEATILIKMSLQLRETEEQDQDGKRQTRLRAFGSSVNFRTQNTYSYTAEASSSVTVTMRPVPAPSRLVPPVVMVNALGPTPTVTISP